MFSRPSRARRQALSVLAALAAAPLIRAQERREIEDATGRRIRLPSRVDRIVAAGPPASVLIFAVAPDSLAGWTTPFRESERPFIAGKYANLPVLGRLTGRGNTANVEVVLAAKPDVIVDYGAVNATFASLAARVQEQTGIPYILLDGAFDAIPVAIRTVGALTGSQASADSLANYAGAVVSEVDRKLQRVPAASRVRVYYARGPRGLETGLLGSINTEILERAGGVNVAAELGHGGLAQVSLEQVLAWNPDVIVTTDAHFFSGVRADPLWREVAAVRTGRVHLAPAVPFGWIDFPPSINRLVGLRWLARIFYPDAFVDDLRPQVREFYTRVYHQAPTEAQLEALLSPPRPRGTV